MKILGYVDVDKIKVNNEYDKLFPPLSDTEYRSLYDDIKRVGEIHTNLILERNGNNNYIVLAGHTRLKIARQLGMSAVPCTLVETIDEKYSALFDNIARRQLKENDIAKFQSIKEKMMDNEALSKLPPSFAEKYKNGSLDKKALYKMINIMENNECKDILTLFTAENIEMTSHEETEKKYLEKIANIEKNNKEEIAKLKAEYEAELKKQKIAYEHETINAVKEIEKLKKDIERENSRIEQINAEKAKKEKELKELKELQDKNRAVLEEAMAKYNATKEVIAEEVQKEYRKEIEEYEKEKAKFSESIKEKDNNIAKLKNDLEVAKLNVEGKQAEVQALRNHVNDMKTIYNETINKYSDPTLIMAPLIVANEYLGNVIMLAKEHRWYEKTLKETKQYIAKIKNNLDRVITEMEINLVTDEINKMADDADKIAESAKKAYLEAARKKDNNDTTQEYDNVINFNK